MREKTPTVGAGTAAHVAELFLWAQTVPGIGRRAKASQMRARRQGWFPPAAWDDIDDPAESPDPAILRGYRAERMTSSETLDEAEWLLEAGESPDYVAAQLKASVHAIERAAHRHGRLDLARAFRPGRRDSA